MTNKKDRHIDKKARRERLLEHLINETVDRLFNVAALVMSCRTTGQERWLTTSSPILASLSQGTQFAFMGFNVGHKREAISCLIERYYTKPQRIK